MTRMSAKYFQKTSSMAEFDQNGAEAYFQGQTIANLHATALFLMTHTPAHNPHTDRQTDTLYMYIPMLIMTLLYLPQSGVLRTAWGTRATALD